MGHALKGLGLLVLMLAGVRTPAQEWNWQCLSGYTDAKASAIRGTRGEPSTANRVGKRKGMMAWTGADQKIYLYGGLGQDTAKAYVNAEQGTVGLLGHDPDEPHESDLSDLWRLDPATGAWTWLAGGQVGMIPPRYGTLGAPEAANTPGGRSRAATWTGADGMLYLFGGACLTTSSINSQNFVYRNDFWRCDPATGVWTWLGGSQTVNHTGVAGKQGVSAAANMPGNRALALTWTGADGRLYLYGGYGVGVTAAGSGTTATGHLGDLWRYDPASGQWTWISGRPLLDQSPTCGARGSSAAANTPGSRIEPAAWVGGDGKFYLFGGERRFYQGGNYYYYRSNDVWRFDPASGLWAWIGGSLQPDRSGVYGKRGVAATVNTPGARQQVLTWTGGDGKLYLFGGKGRDAAARFGMLGDLWRFDTTSLQWTWLGGSSAANQTEKRGARGSALAANDPGSRSDALCWRDAQGGLCFMGGLTCVTEKTFSPHTTELWRHDPAEGTWAWLTGDLIPHNAGIYGTQGTANPANRPGGRVGSTAWHDPVNGACYLFGGYGLDGATDAGFQNDLWRRDRVTGRWSWLKGRTGPYQWPVYGARELPDPANTPGGRRGATAWTGPDRRLYVFGGTGWGWGVAGGPLNDLWRFDPATSMWTWLAGTTTTLTGAYGTRGVPAKANNPGAREGAAGWPGPDGMLYLFGGKGVDANGTQGQLNDFWRYDPVVNMWTWIGGSKLAGAPGSYGRQLTPSAANIPGARHGATVWTNGGMVYLFGGFGHGETGASGRLNDLWRFDPAAGQWTWLKGGKGVNAGGNYGMQGKAGPANTPGGRKDALGAVAPQNKLLLFGGLGLDGAGQAGFLNDFWELDLVTLNWTWLKGSQTVDQVGVMMTGGAAVANIPSARAGATAWVDKDFKLVVFGGFGLDGSGYRTLLGDTWIRGEGAPGGNQNAAQAWGLYR